MHFTPRAGVTVGIATLAGLLVPTASADGSAILGGGAGITVNGTACTLTTIGHDNSGELIGITAATCGGPGSSVAGVGTVVAADDALDYAVIKFDPGKVIPVGNFAGFAINGIGPDPSGFGQPVCTQGGATGNACGTFKFGGPRPGIVAAHMPSWQPGDDGAPITVDGQLVGMTRDGYTGLVGAGIPTLSTHITFTLFSAILGDLNAKGGPGSGFSPVLG